MSELLSCCLVVGATVEITRLEHKTKVKYSLSCIKRGDFILENKIEKYFRDEIEKINGKALKFYSPGNNGVPDRIVLLNGKCYFVELKKPGAKPRKLQKAVMKTFNKLGFKVYVIDSIEKVDLFIRQIWIEEVGDQSHG